MKRAERQRLVKQLIMQQEVETRDELITRSEEIGVRVIQATVSRDVREIDTVKVHGADGHIKYTILSQTQDTSSEEELRELVKDSVVRVERIQFTVILHTETGDADVVSSFLDEVTYPEVAGAVTGVDTIIVVTRSEEDAEHSIERIENMIFQN